VRFRSFAAAGLAIAAVSSSASAQLTTTSPSGGSTVGATVIGGIVTDLKGVNGQHVLSQIAASSLFTGYQYSSPQLIGSRTGYTPGVLAALGGGIADASFRFTLSDGDNASGNFDYNDNGLLVNGFSFGGNNWSAVTTVGTDGVGNVTSGPGLGFADNELMTGWFQTTDNTFLTSLFADLLSTGTLSFYITDVNPGDNFLDFTQGVDGSLINAEQGPTVTTPEPASLALLATGLVGIGGLVRRKRTA
jgi:hypothetical protein